MSKLFKKVVSILLVAVMVFGSAPLAGFVGIELPEFNLLSTKAEAATYSGKCGENITWKLDTKSGELTISGTGDMKHNESHYAVPWDSYVNSIISVKIENGITRIANYSFWGCINLIEIIIPDSVTSIGSLAFVDCKKLANIAIPDSVIEIGDQIFQGCESLTSITIPDGVKYITHNLFYGCKSLTSVIIPDSITYIPSNAFAMCESLKSVNIPDGVKTIYDYAFSGCKSLETMSLGSDITKIGTCAFIQCYNLKNVYYSGTSEQWDDIVGNDNLSNATIYYGHIHSISDVLESFSPTCNEDGYKKGTCVCEYDYIEIFPALNHKDTLVKVDAQLPTCTEIGWDAYEYCTVCDYTTYTEKVALKHNIIIDEAVDATCTATGLTAGQHCSRCDDETVEQEIVPALNHKDTLIQVGAHAPTCTEIGWEAYEYCTACDYTTYIEKGALEHDIIIDEAVESTCTSTGLTAGQHCSRCDDMTIAQEIVPSKPHNPTEKYDSSKHWNECGCGLITDEENHSFVGGNICSCGYKRTTNAIVSIKNNTGSKTINYGETLKLTAVVTNKPTNAKIYWYIDGIKSGEGEVFNISFENGTKIVTVKLVDENGVAYEDANGSEITDSETITVKAGFFQKLISFFKNLFGSNRTVVQTIFKGIF